MTNGFRFTCKAESFGLAGGLMVSKGWVIELHTNDKRMSLFRGNPSFESEPIEVPEPDTQPETKASVDDSDTKNADTGDTDKATDDSDKTATFPDVGIETIAELGQEVITMLQQAGFATIGAVIHAGKEELKKIKGIGDATADTILSCCEAFIDQD